MQHRGLVDEVARLTAVVARHEEALGEDEDELAGDDEAPAPRVDLESADAFSAAIGEGIVVLAGEDDDPVATGIELLAGEGDPLDEGVALLTGTEHLEEERDGDEDEESALSEEPEASEVGFIATLGRLVAALGIAFGYLEAGLAVLSGVDIGPQSGRAATLNVPRLGAPTELRPAASPTLGAHAPADQTGEE